MITSTSVLSLSDTQLGVPSVLHVCLSSLRAGCLLIAGVVAVALLQILKSSGLRHDLKKLTTKLKRHVDDFDRAVTQAERGRSIEADEQIQEGINLLAKQASTSQSASYPPPGKFPLHSINIAENPCFVGRESQLKKLHKLLVDDHKGAEPVACALYGNPGVGKTQMALRFTYQHRAEFDAVFWVSAAPDQGTETLRTFGNIGRRLGLFKNEEIDDAQVEIVLGWLQTAGMMFRVSVPISRLFALVFSLGADPLQSNAGAWCLTMLWTGKVSHAIGQTPPRALAPSS